METPKDTIEEVKKALGMPSTSSVASVFRESFRVAREAMLEKSTSTIRKPLTAPTPNNDN